MRDVWLVARREFAYFVLRRGFIISMLLVPVWIIASILIPIVASRSASVTNYVVIDQSGLDFITAIDAAQLRSETRIGLELLAIYVRTTADLGALTAAEPEIAKLLSADPIEQAQVDAAIAMGGLKAISEKPQPYLPPGSPSYLEPPARFKRMDAPAELAAATPDAIRAFLARQTAETQDRVSAVLLIPSNFGEEGVPAALWAKGLTASGLRSFVSRAATQQLQLSRMSNGGIDTADGRQILNLTAKIETFDPAPQANGKPVSVADRVRQLAPLAMSGVLFFVVFLSSSMLLGSVLEDKSSRVVEVILSCVTASSLMTGKLLGAAAAAMTIVLLWGGGIASVALYSADASALLGTAFDAIVRPDFLPLALVLFVEAFLIYCSMFLIAASVAKTPQDAQAYVGPMMLVVMLPFFFIAALIADQNSLLAQVLTFIPIYTPFILMMRLGAEPPVFDVIAGSTIATLTAIGMVWIAARLYQRNAVPVEGGPPRA